MSYTVTSDHVENLQGGRMVGPGDEVSDADAKRNPHLIEKGRLTKRPTRRKGKGVQSTGTAKAQKTAAEPQEEDGQ